MGLPVVVAAVDGGPDSYWHRRADGSDALTMLLEEFSRVGDLRAMTVAVFCGTGDPFYPATRHLTGLMDYPHQARFGPGWHDDAYWRSVAAAQLRAIGRAPGITR